MRPPESWQRAKVTLGIAAVTVLAWVIAAGIGVNDIAAVWGGFIPARVSGLDGDGALAPVFLTPFTATLVHAGFIHLGFNLLILVFCGRATEAILGGPGIAILYVAGAYAAAAAQYLAGPAELVPMIGASGAISAILGAYAILFGRNRVKIEHPTLAMLVNALWLAAAWIGLQLLIGITFNTGGMTIAIAAHIGGFLVGLLLAKPLLMLRYRNA